MHFIYYTYESKSQNVRHGLPLNPCTINGVLKLARLTHTLNDRFIRAATKAEGHEN